MNREKMLQQLGVQKLWDFIVIGGGATGAGLAVEAASRGYQVALLEQHDFAKGTSSRSTKLAHGGVRYLQQGNIALVLEALKERGILLKNAPHLVHDLAFIVPSYDWWQGPFYGIGLKLYDMLAGKAGFGHSRLLSEEETIEHLPNIEKKGLRGGVIYYDGQFDDARLVINLLQTAVEQGATVCNYTQVTGLLKQGDEVKGVLVQDSLNHEEFELRARVVINATGPFSDSICRMDVPRAPKMIQPSRGVHIVLDRSFLSGDSAIMVPHTDDGRVLFAIPWYDRTVVGTTDTPITRVDEEPQADEEEIEFLLKHAARYLTKDPKRKEIKSIFAGIRPLVSMGNEKNTAAISREHVVHISASGLVTVAGGKWTTYRKMAQDTLDQAIVLADVDFHPSVSEHLNIHGFHEHAEQFKELAMYGNDAPKIRELAEQNEQLAATIISYPKIIAAEVLWAIEHEMACTIEDFLARRRRLLFLDAMVAMQAAPGVARLMARYLNKDQYWIENQIHQLNTLARNYLP